MRATLAEGGFVAFLDHDDELEPLALARVAAEIGRHPEADLLYGDEDLVGTDGRRYDPYFKPDWNPELLRAQNYVCHLAVYRAALLSGLDAFRPEVQGSQDWDLALRVTEKTEPAKIHHIPCVLYHWRAIAGSTASHLREKSYASAAAGKVLRQHADGSEAALGAFLLAHAAFLRCLRDEAAAKLQDAEPMAYDAALRAARSPAAWKAAARRRCTLPRP